MFQLWKALSIDFSHPLHLLKELGGRGGGLLDLTWANVKTYYVQLYFYFRLTLGEFVIFYFQLFKLSFHYLSSY
jgi:hypothetical protein